MKPYYVDECATVYHGDCLKVMAELPATSIDAIVTDPPYGLGFMGREWDDLPPGKEWADECLRVLKPGGHLLAFGGTRTYHRLACAIEDAGFEIRDSITWIYGSGFPKSRNLDGQWQGWGTALKPASEPIVVARKPLVGTVVQNVLALGTGALNIDGCRVAGEQWTFVHSDKTSRSAGLMGNASGTREGAAESHPSGRWPPNVVMDEAAAGELDRQSGVLHTQDPATRYRASDPSWSPSGTERGDHGTRTQQTGGDVEKGTGASRFFPVFRYEAKASTYERPRVGGPLHPTVKPLDLIRWLVRLVTPPGGLVLEPFAGSGTTVEACLVEGFRCIGIEREAAYLPLIQARLSKPLEPVLDFGQPA